MTSTYEVRPEVFDKEIYVPSSKSYANRALILSALSLSTSTIKNFPESTDVLKMIDCLREVGLEIEIHKRDLIVKNSFPLCEMKSPPVLKTGDGGTTNRFIIPLLARGKNKYLIEATGHMKNRPMKELIDALKLLGVQVEEDVDAWLSIKGPLQETKKNLKIDCAESTQFITGLSLAGANLKIDFIPKNLNSSEKYFSMTKNMIQEFKSGNNSWSSPVDFSGLSYPLALAVLMGKVKVLNCFSEDPYQADAIFLKILRQAKANIKFESDGLVVKKSKLEPFEVDGQICPDLVPTLAFLASYIDGKSSLKNLEVLRYKESDRVDEVLKLLKTFEIQFDFNPSSQNLTIFGNSKSKVSKKINYDPPADHRIIMVAYLFMRMNQGGELKNYEHVKKSFPDFFSIMSK